jgi:hypothetical protein
MSCEFFSVQRAVFEKKLMSHSKVDFMCELGVFMTLFVLIVMFFAKFILQSEADLGEMKTKNHTYYLVCMVCAEIGKCYLIRLTSLFKLHRLHSV